MKRLPTNLFICAVFLAPACDSSSDDTESASASEGPAGETPGEDADTMDPDTDGPVGETPGDDEVDTLPPDSDSDSDGDAELCSCFNPEATEEVPGESPTTCLDLDDVFLGCDFSWPDCGEFETDLFVGGEYLAPSAESVEALACVLEGLGADELVSFSVQSSTDDDFLWQSRLLPFAGGGYGEYLCALSSGSVNTVSTRSDVDAAAIQACNEAWGGSAEGEPYQTAANCLFAAMPRDEESSLAACE